MNFTFLFRGGPLDGRRFDFDPGQPKPLDFEFGGKAWLDTLGGAVGRQFTVANPYSPPDERGNIWEFKERRYQVTGREVKGARVSVNAKRICAIRGSGSGPYEEKCADFLRRLSETQEEVVVVDRPEVMGETFSHIVESLNRLADAKKRLQVMSCDERHS